MEKINVCLACDDRYAKYAGVVIASVLSNANTDDVLSIYILDGGISNKNKEKLLELLKLRNFSINFITIDNGLFKDYTKVKTHSYISLPSYYRLKLASILPEVDKIIYLDCDVIVNTSLKELFNSDLKDNPIGGINDISKKKVKKNPSYVNAGVLLMDLNKIRTEHWEEVFLNWTLENFDTITTGDQEILNETLKGKITIIDASWNVQSSNFTNRSSYTSTPKIIHFTAKQKPWHFGSFSWHKKYYFKYLEKTPWALNEDEKFYWYQLNQIVSLWRYFVYRPLFILRPRFYTALYYTYIRPFIEKFIYSKKDYGETHNLYKIFGAIKIKLPKYEVDKLRKQNKFYYYKKHNIDITTVPKAEGELRKIQLALLSILLELDKVCKTNDLKYWLDGGTQIGAVRHRGFIPWDDDIDCGMLRVDYEKLIEAFKNTEHNPDIYADYYRDPRINGSCFIKIMHKKNPNLFIDIFPFDFYYKKLNIKEKNEKSIQVRNLRKEISNKTSPKTTNKELLEMVYNIRDNIILEGHSYNLEDKPDIFWGLEYPHRWKNWMYDYETFFPLKEIDFEGYRFPIINNPDAFLTGVYGNYMGYPNKIGCGHNMYKKMTKNEKDVIDSLINNLKETV